MPQIVTYYFFTFWIVSWCCGRMQSPSDVIQKIDWEKTVNKTKQKGKPIVVSASSRNTHFCHLFFHSLSLYMRFAKQIIIIAMCVIDFEK